MIADLETNGTLKREQQTTIRRINLGELHASPTNPRQHFDAEALAELAASIEEHGVKMPLLARPSKAEPGKYEIVAGERRFRATTLLVTRLPERMELAGEDADRVKALETLLATRVDVPVIVEDLDDATVLELQLIENLQRRDLTALEEARGYQRLLDLAEKGYTPQKIAQKIGKSVDTVLNKLKMLKAPKAMQEALDAGLVGERHLVLVAAIPGHKAREECAKRVLSGGQEYDDEQRKWVKRPLGVRDTLVVINEDYRASLKGVPWDLNDPQLVPDAGACATCPFFAQHAAKEDRDLADELGNGRGQTDPLTCLNPKCHRSKHDAIFSRKKAEAKDAGTVTIVPAKEASKLVSDDGGVRNSGYVRLDHKPGYEHTGHYDREKNPIWRDLVEDRLPAGAIQVVNTKEAGVIELVEVKVAIAAAREHKKHGKLFQKVTAAGKKVLTDAEKKAKEAEAFENKVNARSKLCLMQYLRDRALEKGMDRDAALAVLDTVLREAGKDGCQMMAELLVIAPREKKKHEYGVVADAYREPILEALRAQDTGKPELDALIMLGVISKYVKAWGIKFQSLTPLQDYFGFDEKTIKTLATAEVKAEIEAKAAKKKPVKTAGKDHTDPTHVDSKKEALKTQAADKRHKEKISGGVVRAVSDYKCDACGVDIYSPPGAGAKLCVIPKGELKCKACGGAWDNYFAGVKSAGFDIFKLDDAQQVEGIARGEWSYVDCLGATPKKGTPAYHEHEDLRAKLVLGVEEWNAAAAKKKASPGSLKGKKGSVVVTQAHRDFYAAEDPTTNDLAVKFDLSYKDAESIITVLDEEADAATLAGPSKVEQELGIQESKLGKATGWTPADVEAGAKLLKAATHKVADLIGPKPGKGDAIKLKNWNAVRLRLLRKAGQVK